MGIGNKMLQTGGDVIRGASALGGVASIGKWYRDIETELMSSTVESAASDLTGAVAPFLTAYGIGEVVNAIKDYKNDKEKPHFLDHVKRVGSAATVACLPVAYATDGDLVYSLLIPAGMTIAGHLAGYAKRMFTGTALTESSIVPDEK